MGIALAKRSAMRVLVSKALWLLHRAAGDMGERGGAPTARTPSPSTNTRSFPSEVCTAAPNSMKLFESAAALWGGDAAPREGERGDSVLSSDESMGGNDRLVRRG